MFLKAQIFFAILVSSLGVAAGSEDVLTADLEGKEYVFDQKVSLDSLDGAIEGLKSDIKKAKDKGLNYSFVERNIDLYGILLGFAHCGKVDARLKESLYRLKDELGWVPVPSYLGLGEEREVFWKSFVVSEKGTGNRLIPDSLQWEFNLYTLVRQVEEQITKRTGERFDDYKGRGY